VVRDSLQRPLGNLRVSVTDRCNLRCAYCMPEEDYRWLDKRLLLTFEEIARVVSVFSSLGVDRVRLTGGEPLLRQELPQLVAMLAANPRLRDLAMTTNGVQLATHARALRAAGLQRVTVSLDTLDRRRFLQLARRDALPQVLEGIAAAGEAGFSSLKLDAVMLRGTNDSELLPLLRYAATVGAELRFIEYMDVGGATRWSPEQVLSRAQMLERIAAEYGPVHPLPPEGDGAAPAERFRLSTGQTFGIIASTTQPFCRRCDRSRLTADGTWFLCLYARSGVDLRAALREGASDEALAALITRTWSVRADRGAEERLAQGARGPLLSTETLRTDPHLEMHTRGG